LFGTCIDALQQRQPLIIATATTTTTTTSQVINATATTTTTTATATTTTTTTSQVIIATATTTTTATATTTTTTTSQVTFTTTSTTFEGKQSDGSELKLTTPNVSAVSQGEAAMLAQGLSSASDFFLSDTTNSASTAPVKVQSTLGTVTIARLDFSTFTSANASNTSQTSRFSGHLQVPGLSAGLAVALPRSLGQSLAKLGGRVALMVTSIDNETAANMSAAPIPVIAGKQSKAGPVVDITLFHHREGNTSVVKVKDLDDGILFKLSNDTYPSDQAKCSYLNSDGEWSFEGVEAAPLDQLADVGGNATDPGLWCVASHLSIFRSIVFLDEVREPSSKVLESLIAVPTEVMIAGVALLCVLCVCLSCLAAVFFFRRSYRSGQVSAFEKDSSGNRCCEVSRCLATNSFSEKTLEHDKQVLEWAQDWTQQRTPSKIAKAPIPAPPRLDFSPAQPPSKKDLSTMDTTASAPKTQRPQLENAKQIEVIADPSFWDWAREWSASQAKAVGPDPIAGLPAAPRLPPSPGQFGGFRTYQGRQDMLAVTNFRPQLPHAPKVPTSLKPAGQMVALPSMPFLPPAPQTHKEMLAFADPRLQVPRAVRASIRHTQEGQMTALPSLPMLPSAPATTKERRPSKALPTLPGLPAVPTSQEMTPLRTLPPPPRMNAAPRGGHDTNTQLRASADRDYQAFVQTRTQDLPMYKYQDGRHVQHRGHSRNAVNDIPSHPHVPRALEFTHQGPSAPFSPDHVAVAISGLPPGWVERTSRKNGRIYYWHKPSGRTQFQFPVS
jgi:hypothetical protein